MTEQDLRARDKMEHSSEGRSAGDLPLYVPAVDIIETADSLIVIADMAGVPPDNVTVDITDNVLTLRGKVSIEGEGERMLIQEYGVGDYFRQFSLGRTIDQSKIEAKVKNGVVSLTLPKAEPTEPRKIEVKKE